MQTQRLNQIIAIEKPIKKRVNENVNASYHLGQKGEPFLGLSRVYTPKNDSDDVQPPETKIVQSNVRDILRKVQADLSELFDVTATKDFANCNAKASVMVDGVTLLAGVPVTFLLFAEKYVTDIRTIVGKLPTLAPDEVWTKAPNEFVWKSTPTQTLSTRKVQKAVVLYPHSDKHPAQTQLVPEDVAVGTWTITKMSGAMSLPEKEALMARIETLLKAIKFAREQANMIEAPPIDAGKTILGWLFTVNAT